LPVTDSANVVLKPSEFKRLAPDTAPIPVPLESVIGELRPILTPLALTEGFELLNPVMFELKSTIVICPFATRACTKLTNAQAKNPKTDFMATP